MKFAINIFDWLFGKKIKIELGDGTKRTVTEKWFKKAEDLGLAKKVDSEVIKVHILDPFADLAHALNPEIAEKGYYRQEYWVVGKDIPSETVMKFKDPINGDLYIIFVKRNDETEISPFAMKRELWENAKQEMDSI